MNMDLDEPRDARRVAVAKAVDQVGPTLRPDAGREEVSDSPADRRWWVRGERGWLELAILLSPEPAPRIQTLRVTPVLDPPPSLVDIATRLLAVATAGPWPDDVAAKEDVNRSTVLRGLRVIGAWADGTPALGALVAGDGVRTATWELGSPAVGTLRVALDPDSGAATAVEVNAAERPAAVEPW